MFHLSKIAVLYMKIFSSKKFKPLIYITLVCFLRLSQQEQQQQQLLLLLTTTTTTTNNNN